jgi:hypothetical protein
MRTVGVVLAVCTVLLGVGAVGAAAMGFPGLQQRSAQANRPAAGGAAGVAQVNGGSSASASSPAATSSAAAPVFSLTGNFPKSGPGTFAFANTSGKILGTAGTLRRFRVGIETGAPENVTAFAAKIDQTLGDPRSWIASRQLRFQRVPDGSSFDFTIYLATAETARRMCAQGAVDITENGEPYTSCRAPGKVILNLNRWRLSVPDYIKAKIPLDYYRQYVINHEVGHELGHGHELCPKKGDPAPTMEQQTLGLQGCVANAWPYLNGKRYTGPPGQVS